MRSILGTVRLAEVAEVNPRLEARLEATAPVSFVPMAMVSADQLSTVKALERQYSEVAKGYTPFLRGDILVAKITPCFENGKISQAAIPHLVGFGSTEFHVVRAKADRLDSRYLLQFLRLEEVRQAGERRMTGSAGQRRLPESFVADLRIPVPSLEEQHRIAEVLERVESIRAKRRRARGCRDELPPAIFSELFGAEGEVLERWPVRRLGELLEFLTSGSRGWAAHYAEAGSLFLRIQNVGADKLLLDDVAFVLPPATAEARRTCVQPGDVLLSITADLGRTAVVPGELPQAFINQHLSILRTKAVRPRFLSAYLASPEGQRQILRRDRNAVKAGLNFDDIRSIAVPMPPDALQAEFERKVAAVQDIDSSSERSCHELDALLASLQHRAFTGQL